ncbi:MAG: metallophosphoesterase family protein [Terasakiella sp.]|uniref:metallophosphoesterase family protein n=1 Tax=unclassified Terasakiella TaxID=2614952 RepID=UPI003AFF6D7F
MEIIRNACPVPAFAEKDVALVAIGDIHGRFDLLVRILPTIKKVIPPTCKRVDLVLLGDIIDRGDAAIEVLDLIREGINDWNIIPLMGNHEQLLLRVLNADMANYRMQWALWRGNGGLSTLENLNIKIPPIAQTPIYEHRKALVKALGAQRIEQLNNFASHYKSGNILCVHAGIDPAISIEDNFNATKLSTHPKHWAWIRDEFLEHAGPFENGTFIVHGHTVLPGPVLEPHRIGLDTGACLYGVLSGALFFNSEMTVFQVTTDE